MNLTPLIDVVFLLIIFFMLVSNLVSEETVEMIVPKAEPSQTVEIETDRIVVSVKLDGAWQRSDRTEDALSGPGRAAFVRVGSIATFENLNDLTGVTELLQAELEANPQAEVAFRADAGLRYDQVRPVLAAITAAGVPTVHLVGEFDEHANAN